MDKELINEIRRLLNFMEEFDSLVAKAQKESDTECEEELYGHLSAAEERLRGCVGRLLGDVIAQLSQVNFPRSNSAYSCTNIACRCEFPQMASRISSL